MTALTFPVGYARKSRYRLPRIKHRLVRGQGEQWQAACGRAKDCIYEWQGFPAAVDCPRCAQMLAGAW